LKRWSDRAVAHLKAAGPGLRALARAAIGNPFALRLATHARTKIRQMKDHPRRSDSNGVRSVQTKKPHTGLAAASDIGPNVQFRKLGKPRQCRRPASADAGHTERHNAEPCAAVECVNTEAPGNERAQSFLGNRPVREEQIVPNLSHNPVTARNAPR